jgi:hypothetical protein
VTVSPRSEDDRAFWADASGRLDVVTAFGGQDLETERTQRDHVWLDRAGTEITTTGVGKVVALHTVHQRPKEHDDAASASSRLDVHGREIERLRNVQPQIVV